jgi:hypothetical protein
MNPLWTQAFDALLTVTKRSIRISFPVPEILLKNIGAPRIYIEHGKMVFEWLAKPPARGN